MRTPLSVAVAIVLTGLALGGCRNRFTRVNYETIYIGQDPPSVRKAIGKPDRQTDTEWVYEHNRPFYRAVITFNEGAVSDKIWIPLKDALPETSSEAGAD